MDRKKEIIKCIESISGRYSAYEIFTDWIKCSSLAISNSLDLYHGKIWKDREQMYLDTVRKYEKEEIHKMEISATDKNGRTKTAKSWLCNNHVGYALKCSMKDEE